MFVIQADLGLLTFISLTMGPFAFAMTFSPNILFIVNPLLPYYPFLILWISFIRLIPLCFLFSSCQYIYWLFFDLSSGYPQFRMFQSIIIIHFLPLIKITILICHGKLHIYLIININNTAILYSRFGILILGITLRIRICLYDRY